jgi:sulfatase maturation enzyme AslB (radical SAM superfamily)
MINKRLFEWHGIDTTKNLGLDTFCPRPYDTVLIDKMGSCYLCECTSWLPQSAGNLHTQSLEDIVNSSVAGELQNSIADGSYRYCNNQQCSYLLSGDNSELTTSGKRLEWPVGVPNKQIKNIRLAIDDSCNLSCPSCRTHQIFERDKFQLRKRYRLADKIIEYVKKQSHTINIHVGSDGDPFASLIYRYFVKAIKDLPNVRFTIQTNGLLIKKMYHRHAGLFEKLDILNLSIDGATKATYEKLRRGGSFDKIIENLESAKTLKQKYGFKFNLHFVVQQDNWREIPLMLELAHRYNVDEIFFNKIQNWNTGIDFATQIFFKDKQFIETLEQVQKDPIARIWTLL